MYLEKTELTKIETAIHRTNLPYEDVKVELIDHMATIAEMKMEANINLSFEEAYKMASFTIKESIINIREAIRKSTIREMIRSSVEMDLMFWGTVAFFAVIAQALISKTGMWNIHISRWLVSITLPMMVVLYYRLKNIDTRDNYKLRVMKQYAWVPLLTIGGLAFVGAYIIHGIYTHSWMVKHNGLVAVISMVPFCFCLGLYLKVLLDTVYFNVNKLKEAVEIQEIFESRDWKEEWV